MFEKLVLAVTITFSVNLFLGDRLPSISPTTSDSTPTPITLVKLLEE